MTARILARLNEILAAGKDPNNTVQDVNALAGELADQLAREQATRAALAREPVKEEPPKAVKHHKKG